MRTVSVRLVDLQSVRINLGFVGENEHTLVRFDCKKVFKDYPDAVPSLAVMPPKGDDYPAVVTRDGDFVEWTVTDSDLVYDGNGEIQLTFTDGTEIQKTYKCKTVVQPSIGGNGTIPTPIENWVEQANEKLAEVEAATEAAESAAEHMPYIGEDGYWYEWNGTVYVKSFKAQGDDGAPGQKGDKGDPGAKGDPGIPGDPTQLLDDDTPSSSKAYSSAKVAEMNTQLLNAIDGLKDDTEENFANLVTIINGYDYLHEVMTEGKYAKYDEAALATLSDCNVLEFDVSHVAKFKYNYVVGTADHRGLYFVDKNGDYISGVQTIATAQNVTVPSGAVKCYATVINSEDIVVYEIFAGEPPVELLKGQATYTDKDNSGGIKYKWSQDHKTVTISGTRTGASFDQMAGSSSALPTGFEAGKKYRIVFDGISANIQCELLVYVNGTNTVTKRFNKPSVYAIPSDATGLVIRLGVTGSGAVVNNTVNCPEIYTVPDVKGLDDRVTALENAVYTDSKDNPLAFIRRDAGMLSLFHTVGCIGDSLASGESAYKESGTTHYIDLYPFSWGQCLARLTGNTYYNFSKGGLSTKTWLESSYATQCFDGQHNCDMYFIGLGQNDKNQSLTVGTTADINLSDYTQNADTYCGNMGQIIQRLQILQPKAPIFVFIDPAPPSGDQAYNNVIPDIVDLFDNVWIIDLKTYAKALFTEPTEIIGSQLRSGHYSALGYQQIAFVIATYVDWIVRNNLSAFSQVEFIGTNYEW